MVPLPQRPAAPAPPAPTLQVVNGGVFAPRRPSPVLPLLKGVIHALPAGLPTWIYTTLLKPRPLRRWANGLLLRMIPAEVHVHGVTVVLNPADPVVSSALALGVYESFEAELIARLVRPGTRALDIGANVGYYTALLAQAVGPDGHVTAFEPEPGNFGVLNRTVRANGFGNVQTVRGAVSQSPGESFLFLSEQNGGDHRLYATDGRDKITVPILSVDTFLPPDQAVDFVKMDVQGSEGLALRGMRETLRRSPDAQILMEFWPEGLTRAGTDPAELLTTLRDDLGFGLWEVDEAKRALTPVTDFAALIARNPGRRYTNLYCVRGEEPECL